MSKKQNIKVGRFYTALEAGASSDNARTLKLENRSDILREHEGDRLFAIAYAKPPQIRSMTTRLRVDRSKSSEEPKTLDIWQSKKG